MRLIKGQITVKEAWSCMEHFEILCLWFHASQDFINNCPTRCNN